MAVSPAWFVAGPFVMPAKRTTTVCAVVSVNPVSANATVTAAGRRSVAGASDSVGVSTVCPDTAAAAAAASTRASARVGAMGGR